MAKPAGSIISRAAGSRAAIGAFQREIAAKAGEDRRR
jgi:hypothetical protein